jgi:hypothetical protein
MIALPLAVALIAAGLMYAASARIFGGANRSRR